MINKLKEMPWQDGKLEPGKEFWNLWRGNKQSMKALGVKVSKVDDKWLASWDFKPEVIEEGRKTESNIEVPAPEGLSYYGYQKSTIEFTSQRNALVSLEAGLGKTVTSAGLINLDESIDKVLVICPNTLKINWERELTKWLIRPTRIGVVRRQDYPEDVDIVIINFDMVVKHKERLLEVEWDLLIIDESHFLKSDSAKRTKHIYGYRGKGKERKGAIPGIPAKRKIALTGTPILSRPMELFTTLHWLDEESWDNRFKFGLRYCDGYRNQWGWDFSGSSNLEELQQRLRESVMVRFLKKDVQKELPPVHHQVIEFENTRASAKLVRQQSGTQDSLEALRAAVELARVGESPEEYNQAVEALKEGTKVAFNEMAQVRRDLAVEKIEFVLDHLTTIEDKTIIFFHHREVGEAFLKALGDKAVMIHGGVSIEDRQSAVDEFQTNPEVQYFLGGIQAAGVGITLTAASKVLFAELAWTPAEMDQAISRAHRIGASGENILVQYLVFEESLDAHMAKTLVKKQRIIDAALDDEAELPISDTVTTSPKELEEVVVPEAEKQELLSKLRILAALDQDFAQVANNMGFNKADSMIGHSLASQNYLSNKQAVLARKLTKKYSRQLQ